MESLKDATPTKNTSPLTPKEHPHSAGERSHSDISNKWHLRNEILEDLVRTEQGLSIEAGKPKPRQIVVKRNGERLSLQSKNLRESNPRILQNKSEDDELLDEKDDRDEIQDIVTSEFNSTTKEEHHSNKIESISPIVSNFHGDMPPILLNKTDLSVNQNLSRQNEKKTDIVFRDMSQVGISRIKSMNEEQSLAPFVNRKSEGNKNLSSYQDKASFRIKSISRDGGRSTVTREGCVSIDSVRTLNSKSRREKSIHIPLEETLSIQSRSDQIQGRPRSNALYLKQSNLKGSQDRLDTDLPKKLNVAEILQDHKKINPDDMKNKCQISRNSLSSSDKDSKSKRSSFLKPFQHYVFSLKSPEEKAFLSFLEEMRVDLEFTKTLEIPEAPHISYSLKKFDPSKKILLLDLDETLITTETIKEKQQLRVLVRPYAREFLRHCSQFWNLALFTASTRKYAESIVLKLDPEGSIISDFLCREHCLQFGTNFVKDLRIVKQIDPQMSNVLLIDNKLSCFAFQINNGIPILPFKGENTDQELKDILFALQELSKSDTSIPQWIGSRYNHNNLSLVTQLST